MVFYILRPVMPYVDYAINKDFIEKNLCVNRDIPHNCCEGKCYLDKQLKNSIENDNPKENNTHKRVQNEDLNEFVKTKTAIVQLFATKMIYLNLMEPFTSSLYLTEVFIPPR